MTESPNNTIVRADSDAAITDSAGNVWTIDLGAQVNLNGIADASTAGVVLIAYVGRQVWRLAASALWFYWNATTAAWAPTGGSSTSPITGYPSSPAAATNAPPATQPGLPTLLLDTERWDLTVDAARNIAVAQAPYAIAQDAASNMRTFAGEVWYDTTLGVPWLQSVLGQYPPAAVVKGALTAAAREVPFVASATALLTGFRDRELTGQVFIATTAGATVLITGGIQGGVAAIQVT